MPNTTEQVRQNIKALVAEGSKILTTKSKHAAATELARRGKSKQPEDPDLTSMKYQKWYTQTLPVIRQLLPDRYEEFQEQYRLDKRKDVNALTYTISDYFVGLSMKRGGEEVFSSFGVFVQKFQLQIEILASALERIESILANIRAVLQAELFDDEISVANEMLEKSHLRSAGAIAGVVIERHLGQVVTAHSIPLRKSTPTISDLNDALKSAGVYDVPDWRLIQRLGDIRNLCAHAKDREPTKDEVEDLLRGAEKLIKTIF